MRAWFFGPEASTARMSEWLRERYPDEFTHHELDIRDAAGVDRLFARHARKIDLVVHTAAQPSHDWAASDPPTDFGVNANGTLNLLEAARRNCPDAPFVFCSTNKVYGDRPNDLRWSKERPAWNCPRSTAGTGESTQRCRSTSPHIRSSVCRRRPETSWSRSTADTSTCRPSAFAGAA